MIEQQPREQAGFRCTYSTTNHLVSYRNAVVDMRSFIDYGKAFNTLLSTCAVLNALREQGMSDGYIELFKNM